MKLIKESLVNMSICFDKNLLANLTLYIFFTANNCIEAESMQLKSLSIFVVLDFIPFSIFWSISKNFCFILFFLIFARRFERVKIFGSFEFIKYFFASNKGSLGSRAKSFSLNVCSISSWIVLIQAKSICFLMSICFRIF